MKRNHFWVGLLAILVIGGIGIVKIFDIPNTLQKVVEESNQEQKGTKMEISIQSNGKTIIFELNNGQAAKELYEQLPLTTEVEDYSNNEKIFYPPKKLDTTDTPLANAQFGTLAYYAPWGDVVMFYDSFGTANGLYKLGEVISGGEHIKNLSGMIKVEQEKTGTNK